jgi:DNA-binding NtrC family response regulator
MKGISGRLDGIPETGSERMKRLTILIVEEDGVLREQLEGIVRGRGDALMVGGDVAAALTRPGAEHLDLAIVGSSRDGRWDGLEVARQLRHRDRRVPIILLSKSSSEARAIAAIRTGVTDYLKPPFSRTAVLASIARVLPGHGERPPVESGTSGNAELVGESAAMRGVKEYLAKAAASDCNILVTGETGTGKERVAEAIHRRSGRRGRPMVCINCAALPDSLLESELFGHEKGAFTGAHASYEGKLSAADGGTIFLDEIGDMSLQAQAKILRAIEAKEVIRVGGGRANRLDIRIIAATNQDLEGSVAANRFRKDLYYRLNVARIHLPPLRERKEDIPLLLAHYLRELNQRFGGRVQGFTREVAEVLGTYEWPGNVRELKNLLEAIFVDPPGDRIAIEDLPEPFRVHLASQAGDPASERDKLLSALLATNWNKSRAAEELHWSRMTLYRKMAKYRIQESQNRIGEAIPSPQAEALASARPTSHAGAKANTGACAKVLPPLWSVTSRPFV